MRANRSGNLNTVYLVLCGAGPAMRATEFIAAAQAEGWDCHVIVSPAGAEFADRAALEKASGHPVTGEHRKPGTPRRGRPAADAVVIAPATANTVCKLAAGIADTYALDVVSECIGLGVPTVIVPFANKALTGRGPYRRAVAALAEDDVEVFPMPEHEPHRGEPLLDTFPWAAAMNRAAELARRLSLSHPATTKDPARPSKMVSGARHDGFTVQRGHLFEVFDGMADASQVIVSEGRLPTQHGCAYPVLAMLFPAWPMSARCLRRRPPA